MAPSFTNVLSIETIEADIQKLENIVFATGFTFKKMNQSQDYWLNCMVCLFMANYVIRFNQFSNADLESIPLTYILICLGYI